MSCPQRNQHSEKRDAAKQRARVSIFRAQGKSLGGSCPRSAHNSEPCQRAEEDKWRIGNAAEVGLKLVSTARNEHAIIVQTGMSETPW